MLKHCLRREPADHFRTRQVCLSDSGDITAVGPSLRFSEMQKLRSALPPGEPEAFANLGVSLQLIVYHGDRKALVLVEQNNVLKLVSGYVPEQHLNNPLQTAWAELMEELLPCMPFEEIWGYSLNGMPLPDPYEMGRAGLLAIHPVAFLGDLQGQPLTFDQTTSLWPVCSYVHEGTNSLQLVYPVEVTLPKKVTLIHAEDVLEPETGELVSYLEMDNLVVLMELDGDNTPTGSLFALQKGEWLPYQCADKQFSEFFSGPGLSLMDVFLK